MRKVPTYIYGNELPDLIKSVAAYLEKALDVLETLYLSLLHGKLSNGSSKKLGVYYALGNVFLTFSNWLRDDIYGRLYDKNGEVKKSINCEDVEHIIKTICNMKPVLVSIADGFEKGGIDSSIVSLIINVAIVNLDSAERLLITDIRNKACSGQD